MAVIKCKMCGGDLTFEEGSTICECEYCGSKQTLPNADSEKKVNLYNRANRLRRSNEFDKASSVYESIVAEFPEEAEAYWGLCLCAYGIEYVDDPTTGNKIPTCHRTMTESIMEDTNFEQACDNADVIARRVYRDEAKAIDQIQKNILSIAANEAPYDLFICYKETNDAGSRTEDSVLGQEIYDALTSKGLKVFFSRITLEDKLGVLYEPYIYAALSSAKVMLAIGTDFEYYDAVWVKNEWSRFLRMMKTDKTKTLIPCFKEIDAYDIPKEFKGLQAQDMSKLGWLQDLTRGVEKLCGKGSDTQPATVVQQVVTASSNIEPLLKRAQIFLEDGNWIEADEYCEKVLDQVPENAQAYLYKLMAELHVSREEELKEREIPFDNNNNYQKIMRFGDASLKLKIEADIKYINDRDKYEDAVKMMNSAKTDDEFKHVAELFANISDFKDSALLEKQCMDKSFEIITQNEKDVNEALGLAELLPVLKKSKSRETIQILEQRLDELKYLVLQFPSIISESNELQSREKAVDQELTDLQNTRDKLSFFARGERNALNEKISTKEAELKTLNFEVAECLARLRGYSSVEQINEQIIELENKVVDKKTEKFNDISSYKDALERLCKLCNHSEEVRKALREKNWKVFVNVCCKAGETICFGTYPFAMNSQPKPIEWIILCNQDSKILVISKYGLDSKPYDSKLRDVRWESCTLGIWLNSVFYNAAFSTEEKNLIFQTDLTSDNVFLLSTNEAEMYFSTISRMCVPTDYAIAQGVNTAFKKGGIKATWWWLRTPGYYKHCAANVSSNGTVNCYGDDVCSKSGCVRPALWINLES